MASSTFPANPDQHGPLYDEGTDKVKYKSYKKKFLKLRHVFRERMRESNALFEEEERAKRIVGRLQEQNDQLLDLLLDVNDSHRIPPTLHFDLRCPPQISPLTNNTIPPAWTPSHEEAMQEIASAQRALLEAKQEYHSGMIPHDAYKRTERALLDIIDNPPDSGGGMGPYPLSLARLDMTSSHSTRGCVPEAMMPDYIKEAAPVGFLSAAHEEEFLGGLDAWLERHPAAGAEGGGGAGGEYDQQQQQRGMMGGSGMGRGQPLLLPSFFGGRQKMQSEREREKEMQLRNPVSVFNWLAENKVREVEEEAAGGGGGAANSGGGGGGGGERGGGSGGGGGGGGHEKPANSSSKVAAAARKEKVSSPKPPVGAGGAGNATPSATARGGDAGGSSSVRSGLKREKAGALLPKAVQDEEILDEDGSVIGGFVEDNGLAGSRGGSKRKRGGNQDADDAYRPKGGGSKKRKRAGTKDRTSGVGVSAEGALKGGDGEVGGEDA